jgi:hypothetical protein
MAWCSGHQAWEPKDGFARDASELQRYCRAYHREYQQRWRRDGLPSKRKAAYEREQAAAAAPDPMARLAAKYANR